MLEGHCQGANLVVVRAALQAGEHSEVDAMLKVVLCARRLLLGKPVGSLGPLQTAAPLIRNRGLRCKL
jgi:hypothetical protein